MKPTFDAFDEYVDEAKQKVAELCRAITHPVSEAGTRHGNAAGVYVFSEKEKGSTNQKPLYVGRTNNFTQRMGQHTRMSSNNNSAPFAFQLAKKQLDGQKLASDPKTRADFERDLQFRKIFTEQKSRATGG